MTDLLLVCLGATAGLRAADDEFAASLERAGASVARVTAARPREVRTFMATDLGWARAARRAAVAGIASASPRAVIYSTTTAALMWPRPGAIRFDALAVETRPGRHGLWQRPVETRRLRQAPLLVPWTATELPGPSIVVPVPVAPSGTGASHRDVAAVTYGANWRKKGLDRVLAAWAVASLPGELVVAGVEAAHVAEAWAAGGRTGPLPPSVRAAGLLAPDAFRALLRRARVFVTAPRREDYGIAQLEALADGCTLVTTAAQGPYAALELARGLDPRLVVADGDDVTGLATALRAALDAGVASASGDGASSYAARAAVALAPFSRAAVELVVAEELLPRLLD